MTGLQEDVLGTILHFLYAECLPSSLSERTAEQCVTVVETYPCLQPLASLCQHYLRNMAIKHGKHVLCNKRVCIFRKVFVIVNLGTLFEGDFIFPRALTAVRGA